jgi:hypothetical protein
MVDPRTTSHMCEVRLQATHYENKKNQGTSTSQWKPNAVAASLAAHVEVRDALRNPAAVVDK